MECMKYSKMDKKSSEMFGAPLKCLTIEEHGLISEDRRLKAENPKTLWILTQDDMTHDHETDTKSLDATETSSMLLEDVEIKNFQLKELETRAETLLNENEKFIATIKSIFSVCKEYHDKLSCLTTGQQVILKEEETLSEPLKSTGGDTESLKMDLKTLTSMLKEKDQLITELRSQIERLTQKSQEMEELEASLCEKKQTTIENFKSDLGKESLDTKIPLNKNEEIQNQMTEELTRSKVEAAELEEGMKQLEKLKKSHEESVDELKIKEEEVKLQNRKRTNTENELTLEAKENKKKTRKSILNTDDQDPKTVRNHGRSNNPSHVVFTADSGLRRSSRQRKPQIQ